MTSVRLNIEKISSSYGRRRLRIQSSLVFHLICVRRNFCSRVRKKKSRSKKLLNSTCFPCNAWLRYCMELMWLLNWLFALIKSFQEPCGHLFCKIAAEAAHRTCKPSRKVLALSDSMTKRCYFYAFFRPLAKARRKNINWTPFLIEKNANFETWLSKLGFRGQVNVDAHVTTTLRCSQINFMMSR